MIERLTGMRFGTVGFRAAGEIEREDYDDVVVPELRRALEAGGGLGWLRSRHAMALLVFVAGCFGLAVQAAEASFPGRNGLIAFEREGPQGQTTVWGVDAAGGRARQLTRVPRRCARGETRSWSDREPSFSASGRAIVYVHSDDCDPRSSDGIYAMRSNGTGRRLVLQEEIGVYEGAAYPALSRSGRWLAFNEFLDDISITGFARPTRTPSLPEARYDLLAKPAWGSNGRLALSACSSVCGLDAGGHIATIAQSGNRLRLATRSTRDSAPDWSPRSERIVFRRESASSVPHFFVGEPFRGDVWVARAQARRKQRPRRLTFSKDAFSPVWSPDGRYIAYVRARDLYRHGSLWIMRAADGQGQRLIATGVLADRISWQPRIGQ